MGSEHAGEVHGQEEMGMEEIQPFTFWEAEDSTKEEEREHLELQMENQRGTRKKKEIMTCIRHC